MGYYTNYNLSVYEGNVTVEEVLKNFEKSSNLHYALDEYGESLSEVKWYNHDDDMKKLSNLHKDVVFLLEGKGEEAGDIWKKYYKNGKCQTCIVILDFEPYDENKLKEITE